MRRELPTYAFWRRLDRPGHDACKLEFTGAAWVLSGHAVFLDEEGPASLAYRIVAGEDWVTRVGRVTGWVGERPVDWTVQRDAGGWRLDGRHAPDLDHCRDLDFGFTPATNVLQLQRLDLAVGASAGVPVAWMDSGSTALSRLDQTYVRRSSTTYDYAAPSVPYAAQLEIAPSGFVALYPELWAAEA